MPGNAFSPDHDISDLSGKVIFVTGGTAGLGAGCVAELAKHNPAHIFFSGRSEHSANALIEKVNAALPKVKLTFVKCDTSSLNSVQSAAAAVRSQTDRLDVLFLNAGVMNIGPGVSPDGYEIVFATNYLGHALLVKLLIPLLLATAQRPGADVRVISTTSMAFDQAPKSGIDMTTIKTSQNRLGGLAPGGKWSRYGQSKLAQILHTQQLAKQFPSVTFVAVHPGIISTNLIGNMGFMIKIPVLILSMIHGSTPVHEGHYHQCWAATCPRDQLKNGEYYEPVGVVGKRKTAQSRDDGLAKKLWEWTEEELASRRLP